MAGKRKASTRLIGLFGAVIFATTLSAAGSAFAVTPEALVGDYTLTALDINYGGSFPPPIDENDFPTVSGYLSATAAALVFEHYGQDNVSFTIYEHIVAGTYELVGNTATVARANGGTTNVEISMPNANTVVVTGIGLDSNKQFYNYTYRYSRDAVYFTQEALDAAIISATEGLFSQEELDAAVEEAISNIRHKVVPIFLTE